jgi:hypothetical protein
MVRDGKGGVEEARKDSFWSSDASNVPHGALVRVTLTFSRGKSTRETDFNLL